MSAENEIPKRPGRRRRANVIGGRSSKSHRVYVTPEEEALLVQRAESRQVTVSRLLLEAALADEGFTDTDRTDALRELLVLRRVLANTANNVNQIARAANTDGRLIEDPSVVWRELRAQIGSLDGVLDRVAGLS